MKSLREISVGCGTGLTLGLVLRILLAMIAASDDTKVTTTAIPPQEPVQTASVPAPTVDIRQASFAPSIEARTAVEGGAVKFVIRPGPNSDNAEVARILLRLGSLPVSQNGDILSIWNPSQNQWEQIRTPESLDGYAISRAWELPHRECLEEQAAKLPASAIVFLALPADQEMRLVGAVEHALQPHSLTDYGRVELSLARTSGGHIQWTLQRAVRRDASAIAPNLILSI